MLKSVFTAGTAILSVATALALAPASHAQSPTPVGQWELASGESRFEIFACQGGDELCATMTWLAEDLRDSETAAYLGTRVLDGAAPAGAGTWRGTVLYEGSSYSGRLTLDAPDTISLQGCQGIFCRTMELTRI